MTVRLLHEDGGLRTFAVVFSTGEDPVAGLERFAAEHRIHGASLTGIGAFRDLTWGYFDWDRKDYQRTRLDEQVEVVALTGNIARTGDRPKLHAHVVVARRDGHALGGHLLQGHVRPTLEIVVTETPSYLRRRHDEETGLALIDLSE